MENTDPRIRVLRGVDYMIPSFTRFTPEYGKVLPFSHGFEDGTTAHHNGGPSGIGGKQRYRGSLVGGSGPVPRANQSRCANNPRVEFGWGLV